MLEKLLPQMKEGGEFSLEHILGRANSQGILRHHRTAYQSYQLKRTDYVPVKASALIIGEIGQITSRVLVDEPFARDSIRRTIWCCWCALEETLLCHPGHMGRRMTRKMSMVICMFDGCGP
jgi:hypothetical protein